MSGRVNRRDWLRASGLAAGAWAVGSAGKPSGAAETPNKAGVVFQRTIPVRYAYPVDIHPLRPGKDTYAEHRKEFDEALRYQKGESYGIPYRVLLPRGLDNVLVAGRCVSTDVKVHGSLRVMPGCFITGQAAGVAAAMAARQGKAPRRIDVKDLQQRLKSLGGYLTNA